MHRHAVKCGNTAAVASQTYFFCLVRKSRQKEALRTRGAFCLSTTEVPKLSAAASTRESPFRIELRAACMVTALPMKLVAAQEPE